VRRLDVVDWSFELPRLLDRPRARALLADALHDQRVTVRRSDARVAVTLYEAAVFDVVIDNLTIGHWVGATSVKSEQYFRQLRRILKPRGILVYHGNWGGARRAILAGLLDTFPHVYLNPGADPTEEVVVAATAPLDLDPSHVTRVLALRAGIPGVPTPETLLTGLRPVARRDVGGAQPVRDDLLVYEYHRDPVREIKRFARRAARSAGTLAMQFLWGDHPATGRGGGS
jgi:SAM-dependent methyltransferase